MMKIYTHTLWIFFLPFISFLLCILHWSHGEKDNVDKCCCCFQYLVRPLRHKIHKIKNSLASSGSESYRYQFKMCKKTWKPQKGRKKNSNILDICLEIFLRPSCIGLRLSNQAISCVSCSQIVDPLTNSITSTLIFIKSAYSWALL